MVFLYFLLLSVLLPLPSSMGGGSFFLFIYLPLQNWDEIEHIVLYPSSTY